jgi:hypothetical protein
MRGEPLGFARNLPQVLSVFAVRLCVLNWDTHFAVKNIFKE